MMVPAKRPANSDVPDYAGKDSIAVAKQTMDPLRTLTQRSDPAAHDTADERRVSAKIAKDERDGAVQAESRNGRGGDEESGSSEDCSDIAMPEGPPPAKLSRTPQTLQGHHPSPIHPPLPAGPIPAYAFQHSYSDESGRHAPGSSQAHRPPPPIQPSHMHPNAPFSNAHTQPTPAALPATPRPHPAPAAGPSSASASSAAVMTAAPQLRDLKKEATTFIPLAVRRKQAEEKERAAKRGLPNAVNAAPRADGEEDVDERETDKVDLVASLRSHLPLQQKSQQGSSDRGKQGSDEDYNRFLGEIGDLL